MSQREGTYEAMAISTRSRRTSRRRLRRHPRRIVALINRNDHPIQTDLGEHEKFSVVQDTEGPHTGWPKLEKQDSLRPPKGPRDGVFNSGSRDGLCARFLHVVQNPLETGEAGLNLQGSLANVFCGTCHRHWRRFPAAALGECRESETVPTSQSRE